MERLRIPLHRNRYTTRLPRRVVWLFGIVVLLWFVGVWSVGAAVLSRDTVSTAAPEGTILVAHIRLNRKTTEPILDRLSEFPLISNRAVTLSDLIPYIHGEVSLFVEADGHRSIAVRTSKQGISSDFLTAHALIQQQVTQQVVFLSDRLTATGSWKPDSPWIFPFSKPWHTHMGTLYMPNETLHSSAELYLAKTGIDIALKTTWPAQTPPKAIPDGTFALLSTPVMTNVSVDSVTQAIDQLIPANEGITSTALLSDVLTQPGQIILTADTRGTGYLFTTNSPTWSQAARETLLKTVSAVAIPLEKAWELPDQTRVMELIIEPSSIKPEELTISGTIVQRAPTIHGFIFITEKNGISAITNREELLMFWLDPQVPTQPATACAGGMLYLSLNHWLSTITSGSQDRTFSLVQIMSTIFPEVSAENTWNGSVIHLCTD